MQGFTSGPKVFSALSLDAEKKMERKNKVGRKKQQLITNADL